MSKSTKKTPNEPGRNDQINRTEFQSAATISEDNAGMLAAITRDYRAGRVTVCDGWIISETEWSLITTRSREGGSP